MWELCSGLSILTSLAPMTVVWRTLRKEHMRQCASTDWLEHMLRYYSLEIMLNWSGSFLLLSITTLFVCEAFILCNKFCLDLLFCTESPRSSHNQIAFVPTKWCYHQCWNARFWWLTDSEIIHQNNFTLSFEII